MTMTVSPLLPLHSLSRHQFQHNLIPYILTYPVVCPQTKMPSRDASHAGSWYSDSARTLTRQLDQWLAQVPDEIDGIGQLPVPGARIIIAP